MALSVLEKLIRAISDYIRISVIPTSVVMAYFQ